MPCLEVRERAPAQPVDDFVGIGGVKHFEQGVVLARAPHASGDRQQVQIMVAENRDAALLKRHEPAKRGERLRAAIHDVAGKPEARIGILRDIRVRKQFVQ